ncbi:flagellar hook protein FlgE [Desulfocurvus sp.]|jgi:flagellar hook protein FlgE|uniref:flagellar hook protein FlgE n=1 Tax=Desulfocurvus sp. TaxID=2871698 RepID=UPI0025C235BF|nr:flagellar hook protein FlgE [Desulfocurvus sp.]MCK9240836.1 flagellar hook protein FlgE [Desulfocurvus sp.]
MSVMSTMYTGIAGMLTSSTGMSVVSNNLANTSTVGYKGSKITFEDTFYQAINSAQGVSQVGTGVTVSAIYGDFSQGAYETTTSATDLAINGNGYFQLVNPVSGSVYYTRAGDFTFDKSGYLTDAHGYNVQGWAVDGEGSPVGAATDIRIDSSQSPPSATTAVSMLLNLDSTAEDSCVDAANPFFAMFSAWDGTGDTPLGDALYAYQNSITVYDENGASHVLTVYFDKVGEDTYTDGAAGSSVWEYVVTCDPSEDGRTIDGTALATTSAAGLLMAGTLTFSSAGEMKGMTAYTLSSGASGNMSNLANWTPAEFSDNGFPVFTANFTGAQDASATGEPQARPIELNLGLGTRNVTGSGWNAATAASAAAVGSSFANVGNLLEPDLETSSTTSYDSATTTRTQAQDGYTSGYLLELSVDTNGVVTGRYSNGQIEDLWVVALCDFANEDGLQRQGGNLFSQTRDSGEAVMGTPGTASLGSISSNTLEQSNVDMATQMVQMITLQRVYDGSSKIISTANEMLQTVIGLKR